MRITLSPAYGRDYKSVKAVKEDFNADKDFIIEDFNNSWSGKPANRLDLIKAGYTTVNIRYNRKTKLTWIKI